MTEKRFEIKKRVKREDYEIYEEGNPIGMTLRDMNNRLNGLWEENERLKQKIKSINEILNEDIGYIESLKKIEEILK